MQDVERDILVALFRDHKLLSWASARLDPEDFTNEIYGEVWYIMRRLWNRHREPITYVAVRSEIEEALKRNEFIEEDVPILADVCKSLNNGHIMQGWTSERLQKWLDKKAYHRFGADVNRAMAEGRTDVVHDAYKSLQSRVNKVDDPRDFMDQEVWLELLRYQADTEDRLMSTGVPEIDATLGGGLFKHEFGLIFGVEGLGKSFLAVQFGFGSWMERRRVLHITNEMPVPDVQIRYMTKLVEMSREDMPSDPKRVEATRKAHEHLKGLLDVRYVAPGEPAGAVASILEEARINGRPYDLVLIDYLDQFGTQGAKDRPIWDQLSRLCSEFSAMAKPEEDGGYGVCIAAVTHADSKAYDKKYVSAKNMGLSKVGKNKVVDFSLAIGQDEAGRKANCVFLQVTKLRNRTTEKPRLICRQAFNTASFIPVRYEEVEAA